MTDPVLYNVPYNGTSSFFDKNVPILGDVSPSGYLKAVYGTCYLKYPLHAGSKVKLLIVPAGAIVVGGWVISSLKSAVQASGRSVGDLSGVMINDMDIGWEGKDTGFGDFGQWSRAQAYGGTSEKIIHTQFGGDFVDGPIEFSQDTCIKLVTRTRQGDQQFRPGRITVVVLFTFD